MNQTETKLEIADLDKPAEITEIKSEPTPPKQHGGARPGAGRPPKAVRWANEISAAEGKIVSALPRVIEGLIKAAEKGETSAARYLIDRIFGRCATQVDPLATDLSFPLDHQLGSVYAANFGGARAASQIGPVFSSHPALLVEMREMFEACSSPEAYQAWFRKRQQSEVSQQEKLQKENEKLKGMVLELIQQTNTQSESDDEENDEENDPEYRQAAE